MFTIPEPNLSPAARLADMDRAGVDVQVLSLGTPNVYVADLDESRRLVVLTNDVLADAATTHPTRFRALASLPGRIDDALGELHRAIDERGMDGVRLGTNYRGEFLDAPRLAPLLAELDRRELTVLLHPVPQRDVGRGHDYGLSMLLDFPFDTTVVARLSLSGALARWPRIRWILSHGGGPLPFLQGRLDFGYRAFSEAQLAGEPPSAFLRRLYYDTVSSGHWPALECVIQSVGASQLVFGTDCPHNPAGARVDVIERAPGLDAASRAAILGGTALPLFPRLAALVA